jgi:hypothetical protein
LRHETAGSGNGQRTVIEDDGNALGRPGTAFSSLDSILYPDAPALEGNGEMAVAGTVVLTDRHGDSSPVIDNPI